MPMVFKCGRCGKLDDGRPNGAEAASIQYQAKEVTYSVIEDVCEECFNNFKWWWGKYSDTEVMREGSMIKKLIPPRNAPMEGEIVVRQNPTLLGDINDVCNRDAKRQKMVEDAPKMIEAYTGNSCRECSGNPLAPELCDLHAGMFLRGCGNPLGECDCLKCRRAKAGPPPESRGGVR